MIKQNLLNNNSHGPRYQFFLRELNLFEGATTFWQFAPPKKGILGSIRLGRNQQRAFVMALEGSYPIR